MEVDEQIRFFKEFIEQNYYPQLLEAVRKGQEFLILNFSELIKFNTDLSEEILEAPEELLKAGELAVKQFELSKKINITREHVVVLEKGRKLPRADLLGRIAKALNVREDYFFL